MKHLYLLIAILITTAISAQNYDYSLQFTGTAGTGNYQFALIATPDFEQVDGVTADMGAAIYIPSGYTLGNFAIGNSNLQPFEWANSNENSYDGDVTDLIQLLRSDFVGNNFTHAANDPIELVFFEIISDSGNGNNPTTGQIILAENNDSNVTTNFYESYLNINIGAGTQDYFGVHTPGSNFINFETLSVTENVLETTEIFVYPNPTSEFINITSTKTIDKTELYDLLGKRVLQTAQTNQIKINHLPNGVYLLKVFADGKSITKKVVIK
jgi:hypothetical protein